MLRIHEGLRLFYAIFFLFALGLCTNARAANECTAVLSEPLKRAYDEHDFLAACREGNVEAVQFFLDQDEFDVNEQFISGYSGNSLHGLYIAAQNGHVEVVQILVNTGGVDLNQTFNGATPVYVAAENGHAEVVQILVNTGGVDLDQTFNGATLVYVAAQKGHAEVVQFLVNTEGVNLNQTFNGVTPLLQAVRKGHAEVVQILLDAGADPFLRLRYNFFITRSPLATAKQCRPFFRSRSPAKYDRYGKIIDALKKATRKPRAYEPVATYPPSEDTPLLGAFSTLRFQNNPK